MRKHLAAVVTLLMGVACGGSSAPQNAAAGKTFSYGSPVAASADQTNALESQLAGAIAQGSATTSGALSISDFTSVTEALLGSYGSGSLGFLAAPSSRQALTMGGSNAAQRIMSAADTNTFDNPGCLTTTSTSEVLKGCQITITDSSGATMKITADGNATSTASTGTLAFDFTIGMALNDPSTSATANITFVRSGSIGVLNQTINGSILTTVDAKWTLAGKSDAFDVSEAVTLDGITFQTSPSECITGGTLEAKRVWSTRPSGATATDLPDRGAKVSWQGCGIVQVALSR